MSRPSTSTFHSDRSQFSQEMDSIQPPLLRKRKSSKVGTALRKLLGKKNEDKIKSQISLPTSALQQDSVPTDFITSATDPELQRSSSLPINHISRSSALGSHKPMEYAVEERPRTSVVSEAKDELSGSLRPRRLSMPDAYGVPSDSLADNSSGTEQYSQKLTVEMGSGHAITSDSYLKRRSKSAEALRNNNKKEHRMSPIQWHHHRRRSDEIRYWRDSVGPPPAEVPVMPKPRKFKTTRASDHGVSSKKPRNVPPLPVAAISELSEHKDVRSLSPSLDAGLQARAHSQSQSTHRSATTHHLTEDDAAAATLDTNDIVDDSRNTFDFGIMAISMNAQEQASVEDRMNTVEVKLMDLEYAISKLQARANAAPSLPAQHADFADNARRYEFKAHRPAPTPPGHSLSTHTDNNRRNHNNNQYDHHQAHTQKPSTASETKTASLTSVGTLSTGATSASFHCLTSSKYHPDHQPLETNHSSASTIRGTSTHAYPFSSATLSPHASNLPGTAEHTPPPSQDGYRLSSSASFHQQQHHHHSRRPPSPSLTIETRIDADADANADIDAAAPKSAPATWRKRTSINTLTIDHYATLINLVRREQTARIALEERVAEMAAEVYRLRDGANGSSRSLPGVFLDADPEEEHFISLRGSSSSGGGRGESMASEGMRRPSMTRREKERERALGWGLHARRGTGSSSVSVPYEDGGKREVAGAAAMLAREARSGGRAEVRRLRSLEDGALTRNYHPGSSSAFGEAGPGSARWAPKVVEGIAF